MCELLLPFPTHPAPPSPPPLLRALPLPRRLKAAFDLPDDAHRMFGVSAEEAQVCGVCMRGRGCAACSGCAEHGEVLSLRQQAAALHALQPPASRPSAPLLRRELLPIVLNRPSTDAAPASG